MVGCCVPIVGTAVSTQPLRYGLCQLPASQWFNAIVPSDPLYFDVTRVSLIGPAPNLHPQPDSCPGSEQVMPSRCICVSNSSWRRTMSAVYLVRATCQRALQGEHRRTAAKAGRRLHRSVGASRLCRARDIGGRDHGWRQGVIPSPELEPKSLDVPLVLPVLLHSMTPSKSNITLILSLGIDTGTTSSVGAHGRGQVQVLRSQ